MNSYVEGGVFARRTIASACNSAPCSAPGSPGSRLKFLCSHGGRILPRPSDGHLKYVGGETRVISVPIDISFQELMKRLTYMIDGEMILKYQLVSEDLDALVTVKCDEDVGHMFDEMEHYQIMGYPRMKTFLFPVNHVIIRDQIPLDQRYILSINGIVFPKHHHPTSTLRSLASSTCTSPTPRSPDSSATEAFNSDNPWLHTNMPKIQSSPSICNLHIPQQHSYQFPPHYHHKLDRLASMRSGRRADVAAKFQSNSPPHLASSRDQNRGSGYCLNCMQHDNCSHFIDGRSIDR